MAESGERTEQATPKRRKDAREKGQVAKSMEINAAAGLLTALMMLQVYGPRMVEQWSLFAQDYIRQAGADAMQDVAISPLILRGSLQFGMLILPVAGAVMIAGVAVSMLQTGLIFSQQAIIPDFSRLNPFQGFARLFSKKAVIELVKSAIKAALLGYISYTFLRDHWGQITGISTMVPERIGGQITLMVIEFIKKTTGVVLVLAVADYAYQRWDMERNLRMTKEEVKEESKRTDGDPLIKARIRQRQREFASRRMMQDVARATVVITNPTHYAVALRYEPGETTAPLVLAKGQRLIAQKIKEAARNAGVPVLENPPIARALFAQCEVGQTIPEELYQAVAEIIAFVFRQSGRMPGERRVN